MLILEPVAISAESQLTREEKNRAQSGVEGTAHKLIGIILSFRTLFYLAEFAAGSAAASSGGGQEN